MMGDDDGLHLIKRVTAVGDSLDSIHHRMDRFYAWASELQVAHRNFKQRIDFLELLCVDHAQLQEEVRVLRETVRVLKEQAAQDSLMLERWENGAEDGMVNLLESS
jgi:hypothetical protein